MKQNERTFENAMEQLEVIVQRLENGEVGLDEAITLYKEGLELSKWCDKKLKSAEEQITQIMTEDGLRPFTSEDVENGK